jgi:replicative DNA helicase
VQSERREAFAGTDRQYRQQAWESRIERQRALAQLRDRRADRLRDDDDRRTRNFFRVGQRVDRNWWYDDYVPLRYRASFSDYDRNYYRYDGDYLYRLRRDDNVVLSLFPLLGGAYSVGNQLPFYQSSYYNVPMGYNGLYYDTPNSYYRYGDSAIYQVDPTTQLIAGIVALLTGQNLGIGQMLPMGYDVYNVPYAYRSSYYDTNDMWYRYDDGYIYGVDPRTRLIQTQYPVYNGYAVGQPWPSYGGYDYGVPDYYGDLYYQQPNYDYRFASGGIYQVDPETQLVSALVALVTGQNFAVGQRLPLGYDAYNVPFAYRDDYYDDDDDWYRYADGRIYQVDPHTRLIERVIIV